MPCALSSAAMGSLISGGPSTTATGGQAASASDAAHARVTGTAARSERQRRCSLKVQARARHPFLPLHAPDGHGRRPGKGTSSTPGLCPRSWFPSATVERTRRIRPRLSSRRKFDVRVPTVSNIPLARLDYLSGSKGDPMTRMIEKNRWLVVLSVVTVLGCGSSSSSPQDGSADHVSGAAGHGGSGGGRGGSGGVGGRGSAGAGGSSAGGRGGGAAGNAGQSCSASGGCSNGMVCNTATGTCVECLVNGDCGGGQVCYVAMHICVDCLSNADCPTNTPNCSSGHTCGATCTTSTTCSGATPVCETSTHTCVECLVNSDCGTGGVCQADLTCA